jgi:acetyltransferase-like isoleucine patch superfamily enzyme
MTQINIKTKTIGEHTRIWGGVHILDGAVIGDRCNIGEGCYIEGDVTIGNDVVIKNNICLWDGARIHNKVFIAPGVVITNDPCPRSKAVVPEFVPTETILHEGCSICANAVVIAGVTIGMYAMVGAGAVVTHDVAPYTLVYGNPAALVSYICICGSRIEFADGQAECGCGRLYLKYNIRGRQPVVICHKDIE